MTDMTIDPTLFSGNVYFPFDSLKKHYLLYGIRKNIEIHSDFSSETVHLFFR